MAWSTGRCISAVRRGQTTLILQPVGGTTARHLGRTVQDGGQAAGGHHSAGTQTAESRYTRAREGCILT